jgi:hypothetical protein
MPITKRRTRLPFNVLQIKYEPLLAQRPLLEELPTRKLQNKAGFRDVPFFFEKLFEKAF